MRPDQRWLPSNRDQRAAWFRNFSTQFTVIGPELGFAQAEIDAVTADYAAMQYVATVVSRTKAFNSSVVLFQRTLLFGNQGVNLMRFPDPPTLSPPAEVPSGILERLHRLVRRIRVAPKYTSVYGELLGIIPAQERSVELGRFLPKFKVNALPGSYSFEVRVVKRRFPAFVVEVLRRTETEWNRLGLCTLSPARFTIEPQMPGVPETLSVRVRMVKGNDAVGSYSDLQYVTVVP